MYPTSLQNNITAGLENYNYTNFGNFGINSPSATQWSGFASQPQLQETSGWSTFGGLMNAGASALGAYTGLQQMGLAKDQFNFQKEMFAKNWANQVALTNAELRDRQQARVRATRGNTTSVDDYMSQNAVK